MLAERILFALDISGEAEVLFGSRVTRLAAVKQCVKKFIIQKSWMNPHHQFALATFSFTTFVNSDFTSDVPSILQKVDEVTASDDDVSYWDSSTLFDVIAEHVAPAEAGQSILRIILVYFRASTPPSIDHKKVKDVLMKPNVVLESLYIHEKKGPDNRVQEVYDRLNEFEDGKSGRAFELKAYKKLQKCFTMLLAHPKSDVVANHNTQPVDAFPL